MIPLIKIQRLRKEDFYSLSWVGSKGAKCEGEMEKNGNWLEGRKKDDKKGERGRKEYIPREAAQR